MKRRLFVALSVLLAAGTLQADEARGVRHVIIVLDCSRHMAEPLDASAGHESPTRLAIAKQAAIDLLEQLAQSRKQIVTLVAFGHHASETKEAPAADPASIVHIKGEVKEAPPEVLYDSRLLNRSALLDIRHSLEEIQPLGNASLLTSMDKAVETIPAGATAGSAALVVFTSGADDQTGSAAALAKHLVLQALRGRGTMHAIKIGPPSSAAVMHDLTEIAEATGGAVYSPENLEQAREAALMAAHLEQPRRPLARLQVRQVSQEVQPAPVIVRGDGEQFADVRIEVTYYGMPVKDAKIMLRGASFDIPYDRDLEYKNTMLRQQRYDGMYIIPKVPFGTYNMEVIANAKNRKYMLVRPIEVTPANTPPDRSFKVELEKTKFPPPIGPAPPVPAPAP